MHPLNVFPRWKRIKPPCLPLPQMWAPGNTAGCPAPQQPGRTCDSPSGCRPRTGAPLHHPVKTKRTWVCVSVHAGVSVCVMSRENPTSPSHMPAWVHWSGESLCVTTKALKVFCVWSFPTAEEQQEHTITQLSKYNIYTRTIIVLIVVSLLLFVFLHFLFYDLRVKHK